METNVNDNDNSFVDDEDVVDPRSASMLNMSMRSTKSSRPKATPGKPSNPRVSLSRAMTAHVFKNHDDGDFNDDQGNNNIGQKKGNKLNSSSMPVMLTNEFVNTNDQGDAAAMPSAPAEESFLSTSTSSSSTPDVLNQSTLSDTTDLTSSNFLQNVQSRQMFLQSSKKLQAQAKKKEAMAAAQAHQAATFASSHQQQQQDQSRPLQLVLSPSMPSSPSMHKTTSPSDTHQENLQQLKRSPLKKQNQPRSPLCPPQPLGSSPKRSPLAPRLDANHQSAASKGTEHSTIKEVVVAPPHTQRVTLRHVQHSPAHQAQLRRQSMPSNPSVAQSPTGATVSSGSSSSLRRSSWQPSPLLAKKRLPHLPHGAVASPATAATNDADEKNVKAATPVVMTIDHIKQIASGMKQRRMSRRNSNCRFSLSGLSTTTPAVSSVDRRQVDDDDRKQENTSTAVIDTPHAAATATPGTTTSVASKSFHSNNANTTTTSGRSSVSQTDLDDLFDGIIMDTTTTNTNDASTSHLVDESATRSDKKRPDSDTTSELVAAQQQQSLVMSDSETVDRSLRALFPQNGNDDETTTIASFASKSKRRRKSMAPGDAMMKLPQDEHDDEDSTKNQDAESVGNSSIMKTGVDLAEQQQEIIAPPGSSSTTSSPPSPSLFSMTPGNQSHATAASSLPSLSMPPDIVSKMMSSSERNLPDEISFLSQDSKATPTKITNSGSKDETTGRGPEQPPRISLPFPKSPLRTKVQEVLSAKKKEHGSHQLNNNNNTASLLGSPHRNMVGSGEVLNGYYNTAATSGSNNSPRPEKKLSIPKSPLREQLQRVLSDKKKQQNQSSLLSNKLGSPHRAAHASKLLLFAMEEAENGPADGSKNALPEMVDSPARNTRSKTEMSAVDSPARNTRSNRKNDLSMVDDSPARSTRSNSKSDLSMVDSPARNTRSNSKNESSVVYSPFRNKRSSGKKKQASMVDSPTRNIRSSCSRKNDQSTVDSPARNTRSSVKSPLAKSPLKPQIENGEYSPELTNRSLREFDLGAIMESSTTGEHAAKRKRRESSLNAVREGEISIDLGVSNLSFQKRRKSSISSAVTTSVLRKPGSALKKKTVAFGSPEAAEYNISSPSMSMTPLPAKRAKEMYSMPEDINKMVDSTREIEVDMAALLQNDARNSFEPIRALAGSTPFKQQLEAAAEEETVELESNMQQVLHEDDTDTLNGDDDDDKSSDDMDVDVTETIQLEQNMMDLVKAAASGEDGNRGTPKLSTNVGNQLFSDDDEVSTTDNFVQRDQIPGEDHTVELEADMATLMQVVEVPSTAAIAAQTQESAETANLSQNSSNSSLAKTQETMEEDKTVPLESNILSLLKESSPSDIESGEISEQEDKTKQLESNMLDLFMEVDDDEAGSPLLAQRSRRSSLGSRRFSLAPPSRLSISTDGDSLIVKDSLESQEEAHNSFKAETAVSLPATPKKGISLQKREVMIHYRAPFLLTPADLLTTLSTECRDAPFDLLLETMNTIFPQAMQEIEGSMETEIDESQILEHEVQQVDNLLKLQEALRAGSNMELEHALGELSEKVEQAENVGWTRWIVSVVESVTEYLADIATEIAEKIDDLNQHTSDFEHFKATLAVHAEVAARKARRKSFRQKQNEASLLEREIAELELKLQASQARLNENKSKEVEASSTNDIINRHSDMLAQATRSTELAERSEWRNAILCGTQYWRPTNADGDFLELGIVGPCPKACLQVVFTIAHNVQCQSRVDEALFPRHHRLNLKSLSNLSPWIDWQCGQLRETIDRTELENPKQIQKFHRSVVLTMSRLHTVVMELMALQGRHRVVLARSAESSSFQFEIEFADKMGEPRLRGTFGLGQAYPYAPIQIQFDILKEDDGKSCWSADAIRRKLIKDAKPGFGYLSRTVDVISACVQL